MNSNNIIDVFSGVGGLSWGFEMAGYNNILSIDNWEDAIKTYNHNRKGKNGIVEDIRKFNTQHLKAFSRDKNIAGVIGGPPCQGFSSARLSDTSQTNQKVNQERNHLISEFFKTVGIVDPKFFVMENVRGLLRYDQGKFLNNLVEKFMAIGYRVSFQLIDTSNYNIPQVRKRLFIVGLKNRDFFFPIEHEQKIPSEDAIGDLPRFTSVEYFDSPNTKYQKKMRGVNKKLFNHETTQHTTSTVDIISKIPDGGNIRNLPESFWGIRKFNKAFQRMNSKLPSLTVDTGHRNYFHYSESRIPTVRENARIQSFPDKFEFLGSKTSQYKQVGNAVPPLFSYALANHIKNFTEI